MATVSSVHCITLRAYISRAVCVSIGDMLTEWRYDRPNGEVAGQLVFGPNSLAGKSSRRVYWYYIAISMDFYRKINGLVGRYKNIERARSFKSINERAV